MRALTWQGRRDVRVEDVTVAARDGYPLAATSFVPAAPADSWVVVNSATAVPRAYYARFARFLAEQGFAAVTFALEEGHKYEIEVRAPAAAFSTRVWPKGDWEPVVRDRTSDKLVTGDPSWRESESCPP